MPTPNETSRLAHAISTMRPDWPATSLVTFIEHRPALRNRGYRDLAVAFAWIAADPATAKPTRILEHGPWWTAAAGGEASSAPQPPSRDDRPCVSCGKPSTHHPEDHPYRVERRKPDPSRNAAAIAAARCAAQSARHHQEDQ